MEQMFSAFIIEHGLAILGVLAVVIMIALATRKKEAKLPASKLSTHTLAEINQATEELAVSYLRNNDPDKAAEIFSTTQEFLNMFTPEQKY